MSGPAAGLFVSDIDGTLVTPDKQLTPAALAAVASLKAAGVPFTVVSSRPPRGMRRIVEALGLQLPFAAFNGGNIVDAAGCLVGAHRLTPQVARIALQLIAAHGVAPWAFADDAWFVTDVDGPEVARERMTVSFDPTVVADFEAIMDRIDKIVAPSGDTPRLDGVEAALRDKLGAESNIERSQTYYVDVTHPLANKGQAVRALAVQAGADLTHTVVIGDMPNDIAMFRVAGFSIAMGQAPESVKSAASAETGPNTADGFAQAVRSLVLPRLGAGEGRVTGMAQGPVVLVAMGVSGAGKTTLGEMLAKRLGWPFKEGDELHPPANIAKMKSRQPLDDADRAPWLQAIGAWIDRWVAAGQSGVISCSALKRAYRDTLAAGRPAVRFVFIDLDEATIAERLKDRKGHYWPPELLHSQFETLEPPTPDEPVIVVDGHMPRDDQVATVVAALTGGVTTINTK